MIKAWTWEKFNIGLSEEQLEMIQIVQEAGRLSLGEITDDVFEKYFPKSFGVQWPRMERGRSWFSIKSDRARQANGKLTPYSILLSPMQRRALGRVYVKIGNRWGVFASIFESAYESEFEKLFGVPWPHFPRRTELFAS